MSITRKQFEKGDFSRESSADRINHDIMIYLRKNSGHAWTVKEITKAIKMKENSVRSMLRFLVKDKLVVHKPGYFITNTFKSRRK